MTQEQAAADPPVRGSLLAGAVVYFALLLARRILSTAKA
jgi:hypothetical protein